MYKHHNALSDAICRRRAERFKSSLGHKFAGRSDQARIFLTRCFTSTRLGQVRTGSGSRRGDFGTLLGSPCRGCCGPPGVVPVDPRHDSIRAGQKDAAGTWGASPPSAVGLLISAQSSKLITLPSWSSVHFSPAKVFSSIVADTAQRWAARGSSRGPAAP